MAPIGFCSPSFNTVTESIILDLILVKNLVGESYADVDIDIIGYFMNNYREFQQMERLGSLRDLPLLYTQWWEGAFSRATETYQSICE
jgi:hypothetical protein